uniref:G-protein coupled receptors family 1 profile domain-containing protein n=1 Tax=Meloidogyne javanica TaxID=6303 RepID=A0A915MCP7_MELJA
MPPLEGLFTAVAAFQQNYGQIHPYLTVGLCIAGTIMNLVTVLVLTRPSMRSPVNVLLCAVACCDILVEVSYLIFVLHFLLASADRCEPSDFSWCWAVFMMFHAHASVIFHAASIWMLVVMAQLRVLTIRRRFQRELPTSIGNDHYNNLTKTTQPPPIFNNEPIVYTVRPHESDCMNLKLFGQTEFYL